MHVEPEPKRTAPLRTNTHHHLMLGTLCQTSFLYMTADKNERGSSCSSTAKAYESPDITCLARPASC
ncbi:hypothetical protein XA1311A_16500 [Xanthomonas arboricola]|nr:hypothetical protein XA1311A_16500 [Xanthomonas arboricola]CAE6750070.1 hypothetical protein XA1311A_16500 [Xanthomonas arboricola]